MSRPRLSRAALFLVGLAVSTAGAQTPLRFHVGGGATMPSGDLGTYANTGWNGYVGVSKPMASRPNLALQATAFYGHVSHEGTEGEATNIPGVGVGANYRFGANTSTTHPYVSGLVGMLQHRYESGSTGYGPESETKPFVSVGGGLLFGRVFVDARYTASDGTSFIPISVGLTFGGGQRAK